MNEKKSGETKIPMSKQTKAILALVVLALLGCCIYFFKAKQKAQSMSDQATAIIDYN